MMKNLLFAASLLAMAPAAVFAQTQLTPVQTLQNKTMLKAGSIVLPSTTYRAPQAETTQELGYCNPNDEVQGVGTGQAATLHASIYLPSVMLPTNEGATLDYINFAITTTNKISDVSIWIRKDLNSEPVYSQDIETGDLIAGWNKIMLDTPFAIDGEGIYVGYSLTTSASQGTEDAYPIGTSGEDAPNGLILEIGNQGFMDYNGAGLGVLALTAGVTGEFPDNDAALISLYASKILVNNSTNITGEVFNAGTSTLNSLEIKYSVSGKENTMTLTFDEPIKGREFGNIQFSTEKISESGYLPVEVEITKFNDVADTNTSNNKLSTNVICLPKSEERVIVMEEGTGAWCGWCPRGAVGMENMEEMYGDKFIGIAVHAGDDMEIAEYADIAYIFSGFPQALLNRTYFTDPYFDIDLAIEEMNKIPCEGTISLSAQFTDTDNKTLEVTSSSVFNYNSEDNIYRVAYILTEDGLTGEAQANYYSGDSRYAAYEDLAFLVDEPAEIADYVYNDVAIAAYSCMGIEGSLEGALKEGETKTHTYTIDMPNNVNDINNVSLIALLVTATDNSIEIVNAAELPLKEILGVENVETDKMGVNVKAENGQLTVNATAAEDLTVEVYNAAGVLAGKAEFNGNVTMQLPEGNVYVVRVNDGNNVVVKKVVM